MRFMHFFSLRLGWQHMRCLPPRTTRTTARPARDCSDSHHLCCGRTTRLPALALPFFQWCLPSTLQPPSLVRMGIPSLADVTTPPHRRRHHHTILFISVVPLFHLPICISVHYLPPFTTNLHTLHHLLIPYTTATVSTYHTHFYHHHHYYTPHTGIPSRLPVFWIIIYHFLPYTFILCIPTFTPGHSLPPFPHGGEWTWPDLTVHLQPCLHFKTDVVGPTHLPHHCCPQPPTTTILHSYLFYSESEGPFHITFH